MYKGLSFQLLLIFLILQKGEQKPHLFSGFIHSWYIKPLKSIVCPLSSPCVSNTSEKVLWNEVLVPPAQSTIVKTGFCSHLPTNQLLILLKSIRNGSGGGGFRLWI